MVYDTMLNHVMYQKKNYTTKVLPVEEVVVETVVVQPETKVVEKVVVGKKSFFGKLKKGKK